MILYIGSVRGNTLTKKYFLKIFLKSCSRKISLSDGLQKISMSLNFQKCFKNLSEPHPLKISQKGSATKSLKLLSMKMACSFTLQIFSLPVY